MVPNATSPSEGFASALAGGSAATGEASATAAADFQSFLTLLTAQLRNQDPQAPLDSTQFVEQLASFSAVEQQIETNSRLETLASNLAVSGLDNAVRWIGKEVEVESGQVRFNGAPLTFGIQRSANGEPAEAVIQDRAGAIVHTQALNPGAAVFQWDGATTNGGVVPSGEYSATVNYSNGESTTDTLAPLVSTTVREARLDDGVVRLVLNNGGFASPDAILAVRDPAPVSVTTETLPSTDDQVEDNSNVLPGDI